MPAQITTLTAAELTALHYETIEETRLERTLANIARRAQTLSEDGYTITQNDGYFYAVVSPQGVRYTVHVNHEDPSCPVFGHFCTCPAYEKFKTCKHLQAVLNQCAREAYLLAAYEARQDNDDDAYAEF